MSDNENSFPIDAWPATAGFLWSGVQLATAIIDLWKRNLRRRRYLTTGFEKILKGEKIEGWEIAISSECLRKHKDRCEGWGFVRPFWPENESGASNLTPSSLLLWFDQELPDYRQTFSVRQYSTIYPEISRTILQIVFDKREYEYNDWWLVIAAYVTDRVAAFVFNSPTSIPYRVILIDTISRSYQSFPIARPFDSSSLTTIYAVRSGDISKRRINILFKTLDNWDQEQDPAVDRLGFIDAPYEIPISNANTSSDVLVRSSVWQSVSIPVTENAPGFTETYLGLSPPTCVIYDWYQQENFARNRVLINDRRGNWRLEKFMNWLASFRSTNHGSRLFNANKSLDRLSIPEVWWRSITPLQYFRALSGYHVDGALFFKTRNEILRRFVYPPMLKWMSAQAFCKSNRRYKFAELKKAIGFDIFDGIAEEDDEKKDWPILYY